MTTTALVRVVNLVRDYGTLRAVDDLSFTVNKGEVLGLLGPNGAGKSTTLRLLSGSLAPTAGTIWINEFNLFTQPILAKAQLGYLPDRPPLYGELTVDEYLQFCASVNRIPRSQRRKAVDFVKERCGLTKVGKRLLSQLSKGYQQRVGIAQAVVHMPALVILDEPTVGLDPIQIKEIRTLIRELGGEHSVILSSHILPEVQTICDRVQILNRGKLAFSDTVSQLQQASDFLNVAFRNPPSREALESISGITRADYRRPNRVRLLIEPGTDAAEQLVQTAVNKDWRLYELTPESVSLEQVFFDIVSGDTGEAFAARPEHGEGLS